MGEAKLCKLCHQRPAEVPDRETYCGRWRREVCKECHGKRLAGDLVKILKAYERAEAELLESLRVKPELLHLGDHVTATNLTAGGSEAKEVRDGSK